MRTPPDASASPLTPSPVMEPCDGNCRHGDEMFGADPLAYDGSLCGCKQCPNFPVCHTWSPPEYLGSRCMGICILLPPLTFRSEPGTCPVCIDDKTEFVCHPAGCGHVICLECFREWWDPQELPRLSPRPYGFNVECGCDWCDDLPDSFNPCTRSIEEWERAAPNEYAAWKREDDAREVAYELKLDTRTDPAVCPVCRARYERPYVRVLARSTPHD
jgi:hypothetical protein